MKTPNHILVTFVTVLMTVNHALSQDLIESLKSNPYDRGELTKLYNSIGSLNDKDEKCRYAAIYAMGMFSVGEVKEGIRIKEQIEKAFPDSLYLQALSDEKTHDKCGSCQDIPCRKCYGAKKCGVCYDIETTNRRCPSCNGTKICSGCNGTGTGRYASMCGFCKGKGLLFSKFKSQCSYLQLLQSKEGDVASRTISGKQNRDLTIPPSSKFGIFKKILAEKYPDRTDGVFRSPLGIRPTPNLPDGFQANKWGDSIEAVKKNISSKIVKTKTVGDVTTLIVEEENRILAYTFYSTVGLSQVIVTYAGYYDDVDLKPTKGVPAIKADKLILSLTEKFGKLPPENIHQNKTTRLDKTELFWMDEKTVIIFIDSLVRKYENYWAPGLHVIFNSRRGFNNWWLSQIESFSNDYFPEFGRVPLYPKQLSWGMSFKDIKNLKKKDGTKFINEDIWIEHPLNGNSKALTFAFEATCRSLFFNEEGILSACHNEFTPRTQTTAAEVISKVTSILGEGTNYMHSAVPLGCKVIWSRQWETWDDITIRCSILATEKSEICSMITFGKNEYMNKNDVITNRRNRDQKGLEF